MHNWGESFNNILIKNIEINGADLQKVKAIEEMSELTKELAKDILRRNLHRPKSKHERSNRMEIIDEMADVYITFFQLVKIYDCDIELENQIGAKVGRLEAINNRRL